MGAAQRFADDPVADTQLAQVLGGQAQGLGGLAHLVGVLPQDAGTAFGRDHRVDGVFEHGDPVGGGQRHGPARSALANYDADQRHAQVQACLGRAGDGLGLAAFLGPFARIGAGGVHQGDDRQAETVGQAHQADRLAVALGPGHAEIVGDARPGVMALFMADHHDGSVVQPGQPAQDGVIVGKVAIPGKRRVLGEECPM